MELLIENVPKDLRAMIIFEKNKIVIITGLLYLQKFDLDFFFQFLLYLLYL